MSLTGLRVAGEGLLMFNSISGHGKVDDFSSSDGKLRAEEEYNIVRDNFLHLAREFGN